MYLLLDYLYFRELRRDDLWIRLLVDFFLKTRVLLQPPLLSFLITGLVNDFNGISPSLSRKSDFSNSLL